MKKFFKEHRIEFAIFFLAATARLIFFFICLHANGWNLETTIHGQDGYFEISRNLLSGNGFSINSTPPFLPYSYGVPGYPFFLFFILWLTKSYAATGIIQLLLASCIPILGMKISRLILPLRSEFGRIPFFVGLFLALSPYQILFSFIFYTEAVFTLLFGMSLIFFLYFIKNQKTVWIILSGFFIGLSTLVKPTVQYVPLFAIVFLVWGFRKNLNKKIFLKFGYFFIVFLLVLSPWLYRNYKVFHVVNLSSQMPFNLYGTLLPSVLAIANHSSFSEEQKNTEVKLDSSLSDISSLQKKALTGILQHPVSLLKLGILSSVTFFTHDGMLTFLQAAHIVPHSYLARPALLFALSEPVEFAKTMFGYLGTPIGLVLFARLFWIALTVFFCIGIVLSFRRNLFSKEASFAVLLVFYFMLTTMVNGLAVNARFRMPVESIIFSFACLGFYFFLAHLRKLRHDNA